MPEHVLSAVIAKSVFSYLLMATIAFATAIFISALVSVLARLQKHEAPAAPKTVAKAATAPAGLDPAVVAAIGAAVHATLGAHRIVWIGEAPSSAGWTAETRARHHASHNLHHEH